VVTLAATPTDATSVFTGWSGDCTGVDACQIAVTKDRNVTANFAYVTVPSTTLLTLGAPSHPYGVASTVRITVTGGASAPTGAVQVKDGTEVIGAGTLIAGAATVTLAKTLAVGAHSLTASYGGSTMLMASASAPKMLTVTKAKATVSAKLAKKALTTSAKGKLTVTVTAAGVVATGKVTIKDGKKVIATGTLKNGKVVVTLPRLKKGKQTLTVVYAGSATLTSATSKPVKVTVKP